jgi:hypothetical protein
MADKNWLVQSCCNPSITAVVASTPLLSEGFIFQDSLGNCYTVIQTTDQAPNISLNLDYLPLYKDCLECTQDSPCIPPYEDTKTWLVESCCKRGVTKIIADNTLSPGYIFQDSLGDCYTVLTATEGIPNIVRFNELIYRTCDECGKCPSPSPSITPSLTQTPFPTRTVTPTITVTPSSTTYPLISKTPSATPTPTISKTPSPTVSAGSPECKCITFTNPTSGSLYAFYNTCDGLQNIRVSIDNGTSEQYCGGSPTANIGIIITTGSACIGERCVFPDATPTPTPTPSTTSVSGSWVDPDDLCMDVVFGPAPTPSTTPTATVSITPTATVSTSTFPIFPSISPTPTISVTPSVTPTKTPTISVSTTPSTTPSVTPTRTVTPTISITKTPTVSITPTKTPTPTPTQSSSALVVPECSVLLISTVGKIYAYNNTTNISTLLPIPTTFSSDIAHTTNKLWLVTASPTGPNIVEYNITLSPFTATYNRTLPLPVGYTAGAGLCAINNTTLISSIFPPFSTELIVQITLNPDNTTTLTTLFPQIPGRRISGDIVYTTDNKIILTSYTDAPTSYYISQYTLVNGVWTLEFDLNITQNSLYNLGLATLNNGIYTFSNTDIKQIGTTFPYNVTQINNTGIIVGGASQIPSCNNVSFQPNIIPASPSPTPTPTKTVTPSITISPSVTPSRTPSKTPTPSPTSNTNPCQGNLPMPSGSTTINGVTIIASGTGNINSYPNPYASCGTTTPGNTPWLGQSAAFTYTLTFSQPVNNIKLPITGLAGQTTGEIFTFTTNGGTPTITSPNNCLSTITGNQIKGNSPLVGNGGGGLFTISAPSSFTTLTITGLGGLYGAIIGIDCTSIQPAPPADCVSCNIQILPNNGVGTLTSGNLTINTTYSGPSLLLLPPGNYSDCTNTISSTNTILLGLNDGAFVYTLNFSQPVNNIKFLLSGGGQSSVNDPQEIFTFNTNGGVPSLSICGSSCGAFINGNQIGLGYTNLGGGGALTQIKATNPYTQIIITGVGLFSNGGTLFSICLDTATPLPSTSPSITPTKTATPSKTPSVTITPSATPSKTPSVTPSITATPSITPSPSSGFASSCSDMLYRTQTSQYYSYNFTTNVSTLLNVAPNPNPTLDTSNEVPITLAHTTSKSWVYAWDTTTNATVIRESNITLTPFTSTFNRNIALPAGYKPANGLVALNNTTLIGVNLVPKPSTLNNGIKQKGYYYVVEYDISGATAVPTIKFMLPVWVEPAGGLLYVGGSTPKILMFTRDPLTGGSTSINQWVYNTGQLEVKTFTSANGSGQPSAPNVITPSGLSIVNGNLYLMGYNVYKVDLAAPYNKTLIQSPGTQLVNSSQLVNCSNTSLIPLLCGNPLLTPNNYYQFVGGLPPINSPNTVTYNGVTISATGTGLAENTWAYWYYNTTSACSNIQFVPCQGVGLGANPFIPGFSGPEYNFYYTMNFSQPVNNIKVIMSAMNGTPGFTPIETFTFSSNGGNVSISSNNNCYSIINGNMIMANEGGVATPGGQGTFLISSPTPFTQLTVFGPGGLGGTLMGVDCSTIIPAPGISPSLSPSPSRTPTPTPTPSPSFNPNALGCLLYSKNNGSLYNYNVLTNTSTQITIPSSPTQTPFFDTHTLTKYWRKNNYTSIKEWIPTNNPTVLSLNRTISLNTGYTYYYYLFAINDTTLLTLLSNGTGANFSINATLARIDITNNTITPAQITPLFNLLSASYGFGSILLTTTNKLLFIGTRYTQNQFITFLRQYSYPDGALELEIDLSSIAPPNPNQALQEYFNLFESNGNLYISYSPASWTTTTIYNINLNSPYTITPVWTGIAFQENSYNSSLNCNTVNFAPAPSPSPTPSLSAPPSTFRTIYKYLDIQ